VCGCAIGAMAGGTDNPNVPDRETPDGTPATTRASGPMRVGPQRASAANLAPSPDNLAPSPDRGTHSCSHFCPVRKRRMKTEKVSANRIRRA
jgi:hypothetical protein